MSRKLLHAIIALSAIGFYSGCVSTGPQRPLTEKEKAVALAQSSQEISLRLQASCKSAGKVESFTHVDNARIRAVEIGANTAQILYATDNNGLKNYDVRFWKCR